MKLYYHPLSSYSSKALTALYEKGLEFTPVLINLMDKAEHAKYRELYPLGKVPLLVLDDGSMIPPIRPRPFGWPLRKAASTIRKAVVELADS